VGIVWSWSSTTVRWIGDGNTGMNEATICHISQVNSMVSYQPRKVVGLTLLVMSGCSGVRTRGPWVGSGFGLLLVWLLLLPFVPSFTGVRLLPVSLIEYGYYGFSSVHFIYFS
jgi:hypothetical protein